jgi:hypothetical protein
MFPPVTILTAGASSERESISRLSLASSPTTCSAPLLREHDLGELLLERGLIGADRPVKDLTGQRPRLVRKRASAAGIAGLTWAEGATSTWHTPSPGCSLAAL